MRKTYTFDDVLLPPKWGTNIKSRNECSTTSYFSRHVQIAIPIASANMRTVTDAYMCDAMSQAGGIGILHRAFSDIEDWKLEIDRVKTAKFGISIGINTPWEKLLNYLFSPSRKTHYSPRVVVIDVAHAGNQHVYDFTKEIINWKQQLQLKALDIVVGNIATAEAARRYKELEIDGLKVGVGGGAACTTRLMTGCGVAQLTAIQDVAQVLKRSDIKLIADGGITKPGDVVKALAAGADCVMMGKELAIAKESPGWVDHSRTTKYAPSGHQWSKIYQGEASFRNDRAPEGVQQVISLAVNENPKTVKEIIVDYYQDGIQSGMSYQNAKTIPQLQENAEFWEVSTNTLIENKARN